MSKSAWLPDGTVSYKDDIYHCYESLKHCRLFIADNGRLGVAPDEVQTGDSICLFHGAYKPCIIRKFRGKWNLISGDCYLQGWDPDRMCEQDLEGCSEAWEEFYIY